MLETSDTSKNIPTNVVTVMIDANGFIINKIPTAIIKIDKTIKIPLLLFSIELKFIASCNLNRLLIIIQIPKIIGKTSNKFNL